ncbi:MAG: histidinol phosphate phosphatase [Chloroflexi bacterium]|nr:histidinol phosphate phosphatase [Chloroflexota bacterium]MCI0581147.1 histidinol phosphate phosphatase [Chloroflexota bacterium]MCI0645383.1 histidinol phosphate phosphatase [Chloroflexota bacterium]MCI0727186.1 histidinol phosphate phosphatase [Chloroflexota bacterium]
MADSLRTYLEFATETAWQAGRMTLGYYQTGLRPDLKADASPVTVADRKSEEFIRSQIESRFPGQAIVGEEYGVLEVAGASHRWIVDPIDGTRAFVRGLPLYAVLLGLEIEGQIRVGVACFPALGEMVAAASGEGCWWNGRPARVSMVARLKDGIISHTNTASFARHGRGEAWDRLQEAAGFCAGWSDAYGYLLVATGRVEVMLDPVMEVWDNAPFPVILEEAGGTFSDWQGNPTIYGREALATNGLVLEEVLGLING